MCLRRSCCSYLILILCLSTVACTASLFRNYGQINTSEKVTRGIEGYQVNHDFRYYISGSDAFPNALIGLRKDYRLDPSSLWKEVVNMTPPRMKDIVESMKKRAFELFMFQQGFEISDDMGRPIGIWYSIPQARTFVHMNDDGTVRIDTPDLDTYTRFENDSDDRRKMR